MVMLGVFDGHGADGHLVSRFVAEQLPLALLKGLTTAKGQQRSRTAEEALEAAFASVNARLETSVRGGVSCSLNRCHVSSVSWVEAEKTIFNVVL